MAERLFVFPGGIEVETQPVNSLVLEQILNTESGKPQIPIVEVTVAGKHRRREANAKDPAYLEALAAWQAAKQKRVVMFLIAKGIKSEPPEDFIAEYRMYLPEDASDDEFKYLYYASLLKDETIIADLIEHLMSQTAVTEAGVQEAADRFQGSGEWQPDNGIPLPEEAARVDNLLTGVRGTAGENIRRINV